MSVLPTALEPRWKREPRLFFTALQFFTRIPVPAWVGWSPEQLNDSARHFPTVGLLVGAVSAGVMLAAALLWPPGVAVLLAMAASVLLTGAFHEDGWADSCDGFGGAHEPAKVLAIMKDSRVGSYATVGVVLVLCLKFQLLLSLLQSHLDAGRSAGLLLAMVLASHSLSRWAALWVMARLSYVREDALSKSKPIAQGIATGPLCAAAGLACLPLLAVGVWGVLAAAAAWGVAALAVVYLRRRLGGYVGDALGATQQLAELAVLLIWALPWL
ncbi:adenosylcobinamide-GDP ribazoletransferase [Ideonella sp.]|uniref:adenosylcobinamide-GDP ribazoletransferase n=1 Tax=Ideonella sp. TaxID=1929293 RepID=UPI003BB5A63D